MQYETQNLRPMFQNEKEFSLAMAYVMMQPNICKVYSSMDALKRGTLFPELDKPFLGKKERWYNG